MSWPSASWSCEDEPSEPTHIAGTPQLDGDPQDVAIGRDDFGDLLAAFAKVGPVEAYSISLAEGLTIAEAPDFPQRQGLDEVHILQLNSNDGGYYGFLGKECVNGLETFLTLSTVDRALVPIVGATCETSESSPIFAIGSAGGDLPVAQHTWIEQFGETYAVNAIPLQSFDPGRVLRVQDSDLTRDSTIRSTTGDLVAYSTSAGVKLWHATRGADLSDRCGIEVPEPYPISATQPASSVAFDLLHLGGNFYVYAELGTGGLRLVRLYFDATKGQVYHEEVTAPSVDPGQTVGAVRLAAFDGGFILFHDETAPTSSNWYMTPYLFTHNDWSPYPATVQQSYPKTTLLGVEMTVTEDRCDVTAVIATRFSTVSDGPMQTFGTNIEGGRFPGLKKM